MNKEIKKTFFIILSFILIVGIFYVFPLQGQAKKTCCVAGNYEGSQVNYTKPNCPRPVKETFAMVIKQPELCAAAVGGRSPIPPDW